MEWGAADANSYRPFKVLDTTLVRNITEQIDALDTTEEEGKPIAILHLACSVIFLLAPIGFVGALTKALCCECPCIFIFALVLLVFRYQSRNNRIDICCA